MANPNKQPVGEILRKHSPAAVGIGAMLLTTTVFLHRAETHESITLKPAPRMAARAITWVASGMKPREWVGVHLRHHKYTDQAPDPAIPKSGDPHSPVQNGRRGVPKVLFGNVPMYRKAAKELEEGDYPARLNQDKLDRWFFDRGVAGVGIALPLIYLAAQRGDAKKASINWATHVVTVIGAGGVINALSHAGVGSMLKAMIYGPQPDENGNYARNLSTVPTIGTVGEGSHENHHQHPESVWFNENHWLDPGGMVAMLAVKAGLATLNTEPPEDLQRVA